MRKLGRYLLDRVITSVPIFVMLMLAGVTWWLVEITPDGVPRVHEEPVREGVDLTTYDFTIERFDFAGFLRTRLSGDRADRYPAADKIEIQNVRFLTTESSRDEKGIQPLLSTPDSHFYKMTAIADRGFILDNNNRIELHDNAYVTRQPFLAQGQNELGEFRGDELRIFVNESLLISDKPVDISKDGTRYTADRMNYQYATDTLQMFGKVRGVMVGNRHE